MISVLFVCAGNICRSPMAEAVFRHQVKDAGLDEQIDIDSAGIGSWHIGEAADPRTLKVLRRQGIPYDGRARQITAADVDGFDYVLVMDASNRRGLQLLEHAAQRAETNMFLHYANVAGLTDVTEVPDPYYNDRFNDVYELVELGSRALLDHIRKVHNL